LGPDFSVLELDEFVILGKTTKLGEDAASLGLFSVVDEPTRRERHENHADT
jgi:hypothetical protein